MIDFSRIKTYPIGERQNKFQIRDMIPLNAGMVVESPELSRIAEAIHQSKRHGGKIMFMLGGAVVKVGCSHLLIDMMQKGWIDHLAVNGSVSIHDFEVGMIGATSEDVERGLEDGRFGMAEETGRYLNEAIQEGHQNQWGYGYSVGKKIAQLDLPFKESSLFYRAYQLDIPVSVHVAIGGDIIHQHPSCDGAALGSTSFQDFKLLTETVSQLSNGVLLNFGSAVILPEAFLKALTIARNLDYDVRDFLVGNFDFLDMYRPRTRLLQWPANLGCFTYDVRLNHAESIPTLYHYLENR